MKNMFKLAAVAVSMALVASLAACSSGDDDVVDASTPEYLLKAQIGKYVATIEYHKVDVSDADVKSLKTAHEAVMDMLGDCADCLDDYFWKLKYWCNVVEDDSIKDSRKTLSSQNVEEVVGELKYWKSYGTEKEFHKVYVYKPAIEKVIKTVDVAESKIENFDMDTFEGIKIVEGKLNERQAASMKAYIDAAAALKAALSDDDKKTCDATIKAADTVIENFGKLEKVDGTEIGKVIAAVTNMRNDIQINVVNKIQLKAR